MKKENKEKSFRQFIKEFETIDGDALMKALDQRFAMIFKSGIEHMVANGYLPEDASY